MSPEASSGGAFRSHLAEPYWKALGRKVAKPISPWIRLARRHAGIWWGHCRKAASSARAAHDSSVVFIVGSGRSGTTLIGAILGSHDSVRYRYEPRTLWYLINPATDETGVVSGGGGNCILGRDAADSQQRTTFNRLIRRVSRHLRGVVVVEKSPINAMRIEYLNELAPDAKYIRMVRDGADVARSVERLATSPPFRQGRVAVNPWWGVADNKWQALRRDVLRRSRSSEELDSIDNDLERGAFEWWVSVTEFERAMPLISGRYIDVRYEDLIAQPQRTIEAVAKFAGLPEDPAWLRRVSRFVHHPRPSTSGAIALPAWLATEFNEAQARLGFSTVAASRVST